MSDEEMRTKARRARSTGDPVAEARASNEAHRSGLGVMKYLTPLVGEWCYGEGWKMNYRGVLVDIIADPYGKVEHVILDPCIRVGDWGDLPDPTYEETMEGARILDWSGFADFGLQAAHWPMSGPKKGPRGR